MMCATHDFVSAHGASSSCSVVAGRFWDGCADSIGSSQVGLEECV